VLDALQVRCGCDIALEYNLNVLLNRVHAAAQVQTIAV
jgi:hypothetical protein